MPVHELLPRGPHKEPSQHMEAVIKIGMAGMYEHRHLAMLVNRVMHRVLLLRKGLENI